MLDSNRFEVDTLFIGMSYERENESEAGLRLIINDIHEMYCMIT